jgi:serine/threonine protein kinase
VQIRVIPKSRLASASTHQCVQREVDVLFHLNHPSVVSFCDLLDDADSYYLVMESTACGLTLGDHLEARRRLSEKDAALVFSQLVSALAYCHARGVFHRKLCPDKILIGPFPRVKLADFSGCCLSRCCRTRGHGAFTPPEELAGAPYSAARADVWALGACLYQMVLGRAPDEFARRRASDDIGNWVAELPDDISEPCREVIRLTMHPMASRRIALDRLMEHGWVRTGIPRAPGEARAIVETAKPDGPRICERPMPAAPPADGPEAQFVPVIAVPFGEYPRPRAKRETGDRRAATATWARRSATVRPVGNGSAANFRWIL